MEQSASVQADTSSFCQGIPRLLSNPKANFRVHKNQPLVHILSQVNQVYNLPYNLFKTHFNVILPSVCRFSKLPFFFVFRTKTPYAFSFPQTACHIPHPFNSWFDHPNNVLTENNSIHVTPILILASCICLFLPNAVALSRTFHLASVHWPFTFPSSYPWFNRPR